MKPPTDGWDRDEQEVLAELQDELAVLRARHANPPPLSLLRAARAEALPEALQSTVTGHLSANAWSRALIEGAELPGSIGPEEEGRLLARILQEAETPGRPRTRWVWRRPVLLAMTATMVIVAAVWLVRGRPESPAMAPKPDTTVAVSSPPATPTFRLALDKPDLKISPASLAFRRPDGENRLLSDLKPAFDAYRAEAYGEAERAFSALEARYPRSVEVLFYQGITRLFLNDPNGAIVSLTAAEQVADPSFVWEVAWYRAVADERAGQAAAARAGLTALCRASDTRAPKACEALQRLSAGAAPAR